MHQRAGLESPFRAAPCRARVQRRDVLLDMVSDRYGDPTSAAVMNYEGSILDLIDHVDANYRTKPRRTLCVAAVTARRRTGHGIRQSSAPAPVGDPLRMKSRTCARVSF